MQKIVVIGAGVGGLTAAALLTRAGFDVTVLEAHVYPGGCAGTFYHKGYRFDAGATLAGGFHAGGPHEMAGRLLGIEWPVQRADPAWTVLLPDRTVVRYSDPAAWKTERDSKLPELRRFWALQEYIADVVWHFAARVPEWPPASLADVLRLSAKIRPEMIPVAPFALASMGQFLNMLGVHDHAARTFIDAQLLISAQVPAAQANALYGAIAMDLPRVGAYHIEGGIGGIAQTLASAMRRIGGQIHYRQEVTRIDVEHGRAVRVHTNKGQTFEADLFLGNLTPWTLNALLGARAPRSLQREVSRRKSTWGAFTLYVGAPVEGLPIIGDHFQIVKDETRPLGEGNSVFVSISDSADPTRAPTGHRAITLSTHTRIEPWWDLRKHDPEGYKTRVAEYRDRLLEGAERAIPGLRERAALILPGTPHAFEYYTGRSGGMVGGFPQTSLFAARGPHTGIPNLWLVGDSVFPGQSTAGVTAGAMRVAAEVERAARALTPKFYLRPDSHGMEQTGRKGQS